MEQAEFMFKNIYNENYQTTDTNLIIHLQMHIEIGLFSLSLSDK